jgi:hypothetical protein
MDGITVRHVGQSLDVNTMTIEQAVYKARAAVTAQGLNVGEVILARRDDRERRWLVSFAYEEPGFPLELPDRLIVVVDISTGEASILVSP